MMCCTSSLLNFWHFLFPPKITVSGRFFGLLVENLECYLKSCFLSHVYVNMSDRSSIFTQETKMRKSTVHSIHSQYISTLSDSCKRYPAVYPYVQFQDHINAGVDLQPTPSTSSPHLSCTWGEFSGTILFESPQCWATLVHLCSPHLYPWPPFSPSQTRISSLK